MKKGIIIGAAVCILLALIGLTLMTYLDMQQQEYSENLKTKMKGLLENEDYINAFNLINNEDDKYQSVLNGEMSAYIQKLCDQSLNDLSLDKLIKFRDAGGNYIVIDDTIAQIENKLEQFRISEEKYIQGIAEYSSRNFIDAKISFEEVISEDRNYNNAQLYLSEIKNREDSWAANITGKSRYVNACAYDGEHLYVPFVLNGTDGIYKITSDGNAVDFFPLSDEAGTLVIDGINVVGDYMYFIAGENTGSGYTFNSPYSIYEMKTDGTGLSIVLQGNFIDLHIEKDSLYALSRELGLVEYDKDFNFINVISEGIVAEFSVAENGVYYTLQSDLTYQSENTIYFYDGVDSQAVDSDRYMHYYQFADVYIKYWKQDPTLEVLSFGSGSDEIAIRYADTCEFYGILDNEVIYSCNGSLGREILYTYKIDTGAPSQVNGNSELLDFEIHGMFYENHKMLIEKDGILYFSDAAGGNRQGIVNLNVDNTMLENNVQIIKHMDADIYTDSADEEIISVIADMQCWHYKNNELNITIEKRYSDEYDTNIYVTHIFTNNYSLLTTGNAKPELITSSKTYPADEISNRYQAIFVQNTDTFLHEKNAEKGMIIREGHIIRDIFTENMMVLFDDGSAEVYRYGDDVDAETLIEKGAVTSFSFGPILVEDYEIDKSCATAYPSDRNPRSAIGYVEPGHYVMIASDGRDYKVSRGLTMIQLANLFEKEGCKTAYNLDGGMTTAVVFMGNYVTHRPAYGTSEWFFYRSIAEIFYVGTSEWSPTDLAQFTHTYDYFNETYK